MAHVRNNLPCNGNGVCMVCLNTPSDHEKFTCNTCVTPWHVTCLSDSARSETLAIADWTCPDCSDQPPSTSAVKSAVDVGGSDGSGGLVAAIRAIEADASLTDREKAKRRQNLVSGGEGSSMGDDAEKRTKKRKVRRENDVVLEVFDNSFKCSVCMQLLDRPVTTPCGHNFCLKCFQKWTGQGKRSCATCRYIIPNKMASNPRINSTLVAAIRTAYMAQSNTARERPNINYRYLNNEDRPDTAFRSERAQRNGMSNASAGKIFVTVSPDHFGPITAENEPRRNQGVLVGECWVHRMEVRQWGVHLPSIAGIAGQSKHGAQSVVLSGGYLDDEDHGEWFLYTGSGGRNLKEGNKRTDVKQAFDQVFTKSNKALRVSCLKGYPVRVLRSFKEKRSSYAPPKNYRYDGIYRIEKCWKKVGIQGFVVCRYLFVRCDNEPAPWTSDVNGDLPRPLPLVTELDQATDITERKESPSWDFDGEEDCWKWTKPPPLSRMNSEGAKRTKKSKTTLRKKLLKEFSCLVCKQVMTLPVTTPCGHNYCKDCLEGVFSGKSFLRARTCTGGRSLRTQKSVFKCPSCPNNISDFLQDIQVNRDLKEVIESLQKQNEENDDHDPDDDADSTGSEDSDEE